MDQNQNPIAVGLDIGTTKIVAMVGRKNEHGKLEILGVGYAKSLGVHEGVVNNISQTIESIETAIKQAEKDSGHKIKEVTVGIAGQHIRSLQHSDYITRDDSEQVIDQSDLKRLEDQVHKLVMLPGEEIIHVLPQDFKVDSQGDITEPRGMYGSRLEANFHVVVGQIMSIKNVARCVKSAGLSLSGITLEPIASSLAALSQEEKEAGVALVDIGGGTTDIAVFKDNIIRHTAVIPFGGNIITEDIREGCSIIGKHAEQLKIKFGSAWPGENKETDLVAIPSLRGRDPREISFKKLSQIIHARVSEILEQVNAELHQYGCHEQKKKLIAGVVLTGGGSKMKHMRQLTEYILGMDTRIGFSNEHLASGQAEFLSGPEFATAVGLVMDALHQKEDQKKARRREPLVDAEPQVKLPKEMQEEPTLPEETTTAEPSVAIEKEDKGFTDASELEKNKKNIFSKWADKFIKMINETE